MKRLACVLALALALSVTSAAAAKIEIVATTSTMGMLARTVAGADARVTTLVPPDRDAHTLLAKPSMMAALRRATLLVAVGADLEIAWLPAAVEGAGNPRILRGQPGWFEAAAQVPLLEKDPGAGRAGGDVHPAGNPHFYMDPERLARAGTALAERLAQLEPAGAAAFRQNARAFAEAVAQRVPAWKALAKGAPGALLYHKDANYLARLLEVPILGYVEPLPGIPPTAPHLRQLVQGLRGKRGVILANSFHAPDGPAFLARELGWPSHRLQHEPPADADAAAYLDHIDRWVRALAGQAP